MTKITLMDGSIGQELMRRGGDRCTPLWSARVMMSDPDMVGRLHGDYYAVGATVATTNTYALHASRLAELGLEDQIPALIETAMAQAEAARAVHGGRIAGSLGPLLASYRPDLAPDPAEAAVKFGELVTLMQHRVDLFLIETISSLHEAEGALRATAGCGKPVWLSLTVTDEDGGRLRSGEALTDTLKLVERFGPEALLINCTRPEVVPTSLEIISRFGLPYGAYANGFTRISKQVLKPTPTVDSLLLRDDLGPASYADHVMRWVDQGATIVGGCCAVGPEHIAEIARRLRAAGHEIV